MTTQRINIIVSSKGTVTVKKEMREIGQEARRAAGGVDLLKGAVTAWLSANALSMLARYGDAFTNIQNRLKLVTTDTKALTEAQEALYNVAQNTRTGFESVVALYQRSSDTLKGLGKNAEESVRFVELLSKAAASSGSSAELAKQGIEQFAQAMANGRLNGDELTSVMTNIPAVAKVLADGLGVPIGALKQLGEDGELTADKLVEAMFKAQDAIDAMFATQLPTISQGFQTIENGFIRLLGLFETSTGVFGMVGQALTLLGQNMEMVALAISPFAAALALVATRYLGSMLLAAVGSAISMLAQLALAFSSAAVAIGTAFVGALMTATTAFVTFTTAIMTNPVTLIIAGITAAVVALGYAFLSLTGYLDEVWAYVQEWAGWVASKFEALRSAIEAIFGNVFKGGKIEFGTDDLRKTMEKVNKDTKAAFEEGGDSVKNKIKDGLASGGGQAAQQMGATFDKAAEKQTNINDVFVAKFEGTGRNIYDLWNNWGDQFIDAFGTTIGELLIDYQRAMTANLEAQAKLFKAQADEIRHNMSKDDGGGSGGFGFKGGSGSSFGSGSGSGSMFKHQDIGLNRYANGGEFMVGGQGGTDSQKVEFMASPNEKVIVQTPAQQRAHERATTGGQAPAPVVNIVNQVDPRGSIDAMQSRAGREAMINNIEVDPERMRRALGV